MAFRTQWRDVVRVIFAAIFTIFQTDLADAAMWLASDRSQYVTGQEIAVDGGFTQTLMSHIPRPGY